MLAQAEKGGTFRALHEREGAFIIPNPWDAGTARLLAHLGFEALATTSAGYAFSAGRRDNTIDRDQMMRHVAEISSATDLPVSGDLETTRFKVARWLSALNLDVFSRPVDGQPGTDFRGIATLEDAYQMGGRNGDQFWFPRVPNCIGWLHRELQNFEGAHKHNLEGLEVARRYRVLEAEANSLINLGIDHTHEGKAQETISAFSETQNIFERDAWFRWRYNIRLEAATATHWLRQGNLDKAGEFAQRLLATAHQHEVHKYIAEAHWLKAQIAIGRNDPVAAEAEFAAAFEELDRYPAPLAAWRIYADLGRFESERMNLPAAQSAFTRAAEIIKAGAAHVWDDHLRSIFLTSRAVSEVMAGATKPDEQPGLVQSNVAKPPQL